MDTKNTASKDNNSKKIKALNNSKLSKNHYTNNDVVRIQRNQAEKQRRDKLNDQIAHLATIVPTAIAATKPLDKVSILRLAASWMRLNYSCLNEKRFRSDVKNYLDLHSSVVANLGVIEKSINGFIVATTFDGVILMCSRYAEDHIGYQHIDLLGNNFSNYIHEKEKELFKKKIRNLISKYKKGSTKKIRNLVRVHMQQRPLPRSNTSKYRKMSLSLTIHSGAALPNALKVTRRIFKLGQRRDFGENAVILIFVEPVHSDPAIDVLYLEQKDCYFTVHGPQGEIIFADHRISTITGYMPRDVLGNSAYQYIHSSDVPIALFAQKAMFASSDGTGIITYRLRIHDSNYIYLQTKGQIRYMDSSKEIRQFMCCNILLNNDDGEKELKKFQDKYAPQLAASENVSRIAKSKVTPNSAAETQVVEFKKPHPSEKRKLDKNNIGSTSNFNAERYGHKSFTMDSEIEIDEVNILDSSLNILFADSDRNKNESNSNTWQDQSNFIDSNDSFLNLLQQPLSDAQSINSCNNMILQSLSNALTTSTSSQSWNQKLDNFNNLESSQSLLTQAAIQQPQTSVMQEFLGANNVQQSLNNTELSNLITNEMNSNFESNGLINAPVNMSLERNDNFTFDRRKLLNPISYLHSSGKNLNQVHNISVQNGFQYDSVNSLKPQAAFQNAETADLSIPENNCTTNNSFNLMNNITGNISSSNADRTVNYSVANNSLIPSSTVTNIPQTSNENSLNVYDSHEQTSNAFQSDLDLSFLDSAMIDTDFCDLNEQTKNLLTEQYETYENISDIDYNSSINHFNPQNKCNNVLNGYSYPTTDIRSSKYGYSDNLQTLQSSKLKNIFEEYNVQCNKSPDLLNLDLSKVRESNNQLVKYTISENTLPGRTLPTNKGNVTLSQPAANFQFQNSTQNSFNEGISSYSDYCVLNSNSVELPYSQMQLDKYLDLNTLPLLKQDNSMILEKSTAYN